MRGVNVSYFSYAMLLIFSINIVYAFDENDLKKLLISRECINCDLSNADLSGAYLDQA